MTTLLLVLLFATVAVPTGTADDRVRDAIAEAVRARMGASADVTIEQLTIHTTIDTASASGAMMAVPEPGSRLDRTMRFTLKPVGGTRARFGSASARVRVSVEHAHPVRNLDRGVELADGDLVAARHDVSTGILRALPTLAAASHARTVRPLLQDACIPASAIAALPAVRGGHDVVAIARIGDVEARATVTAAENGDAGSVIRVVNRQSRRALKARVVSSGLVEIIHD
jgi:flagella basal body P-ring formation protein FlgA